MLHDGEQLNMGVAEILDVRDKLVAKFAIGKPAILIFRDATPGSQMNFVNRYRRFQPVFLFASRYPLRIFPLMRREVGKRPTRCWGEALSGRHKDRL